ncbi:MAG TPA: TetR/AcrR family transcriptional regulator [Vicinamibacteria bacterium]|nr:TetR/AcrR family transcriptional regulator [Vicinamibacteria bacterium]
MSKRARLPARGRKTHGRSTTRSKRERLSSEDRREQLLSVATRLFADQGFEGTTTRQIAERARINEALLFRHFQSKEDLYWASIERKCRMSGGPERLQDMLEKSENDHEVFSAIAEQILSLYDEDSTLMRLLLYSALENHRLSQRFFNTYVARYRELLASHVDRRVEEGRFRPVEPFLAARAFIGMLIYTIQSQAIFGVKQGETLGLRQVAKSLTAIWLDGVRSKS